MAITSLIPPWPALVTDTTSIFQPWRSAKREYIRKTSAANSAASSPPVPARILRPQLLVRHLAQLGIGLRADQLLDLGDLAERRLVRAIAVDDRGQLLRLAGQALVGGRILRDGRIRHLILDVAVPGFYVFEPLERYRVHSQSVRG